MFARYAHRLPTWMVVYPFEWALSLLVITHGIGWLVAYHAGVRPIGGFLDPLAANGLGALNIIAGANLLIVVAREHLALIVGALYTVLFLSVVYLCVLLLNGLHPLEVGNLTQVATIIIVGTIRASHLRAAHKVASLVLKE